MSPTGVADARPTPPLQVGGVVPFSGIDWPGQLAAVVFVQGCPWRCGPCHNPHLQPRQGAAGPAWAALRSWLQTRVGRLDGVVFSGGEPLLDPGLPTAVAEVRALGLGVALHTAGIYPQRLRALLPQLDWVGLDVKAPLGPDARSSAAHDRLTGRRHSAAPVRESLALLRASGVAHECRTTAHPDWLDDEALLRLSAPLAEAGLQHYALQLARPSPGGRHGPTPPDYPAPATVAALRARFAHFTLRAA